MQLLTGNLCHFDVIHALLLLTKVELTEAKYERAVVEPAVQSTETDEFSNTQTDGKLKNKESPKFYSEKGVVNCRCRYVAART